MLTSEHGIDDADQKKGWRCRVPTESERQGHGVGPQLASRPCLLAQSNISHWEVEGGYHHAIVIVENYKILLCREV